MVTFDVVLENSWILSRDCDDGDDDGDHDGDDDDLMMN